MSAGHVRQYRHCMYLFSKLFHWIFIQPSIKVFVFKVAHYFRNVIPPGHHYSCSTFIGWFNSDVCSGPQWRRAFLSQLVRLSCARFQGPRSSARWMLSLTALMCVSKARILLQGCAHFDILLHHWISSSSPSHSQINSFNRTFLKHCWMSSFDCNQTVLMVPGNMRHPLKANPLHHLLEG